MRKIIIRFRGFRITKREIIADAIFLIVGFLVSILLLYLFDIHWSFYPGETIFPPSRYVGLAKYVYFTGSLIGSIIIFFIIKLFLLGVKEEIRQK